MIHQDLIPLFEDDISQHHQKVFNGEVCPYCDSDDCFDESQVISCRACGHIICSLLDNSAEYRYFSHEDRGSDPTRIGAPQDSHLPNASLGTVILNTYKTNKNMYRVCKYHIWNTIPYSERSLIQVNERLTLVGLNHGINHSIIDSAKSIYISLHDGTQRHGIGRDAILSACIYISLKDHGSPRKPKDIAVMFGIAPSTFTKSLKHIQEFISIARQKGKIRKTNKNTGTHSTDYIQLPLSKLPIPRTSIANIEILTRRVAEIAEKTHISQENMPPSLAAGCIAFVIRRCKMDISLSKIAEASEISTATIQKCLRRLEMGSKEIDVHLTANDVSFAKLS